MTAQPEQPAPAEPNPDNPQKDFTPQENAAIEHSAGNPNVTNEFGERQGDEATEGEDAPDGKE